MEFIVNQLVEARKFLEEHGKNKEWSSTMIKSLIVIDKAGPRLAKLRQYLPIAKRCPIPDAVVIGKDFPNLDRLVQISNGQPVVDYKSGAGDISDFGAENRKAIENDRKRLSEGVLLMIKAEYDKIQEAGATIKKTRAAMAEFGIKKRDVHKFYEECLLYAVLGNTERPPYERAPPYFFTIRPDQKKKFGYSRDLGILIENDEE